MAADRIWGKGLVELGDVDQHELSEVISQEKQIVRGRRETRCHPRDLKLHHNKLWKT